MSENVGQVTEAFLGKDSSIFLLGLIYSRRRKIIYQVVMLAQVANGCVTVSEQKTGFNLNERSLPRKCSLSLVTAWVQHPRSQVELWLFLLHQYQLLHG